MDESTVKGLVVNWDGVCVDSEMKRHQAYEVVAKKLKLSRPWLIEDTRAQTGRNPDLIWADTSLWGNKGKQARDIFYKAYQSSESVPLKQNIRSFLVLFHAHHPAAPIVVFGAKTESIIRSELAFCIRQNLLPADIVTHVYGMRPDRAENKNLTDPKALENAVRETGLEPNRTVWYIGYKPGDRDLARNAGVFYGNGASFIERYLTENLGQSVVKAEPKAAIKKNQAEKSAHGHSRAD